MKFEYQDLKDWFQIHRTKFVVGACFVLVFLSGFGAGKYDKARAQKSKSTSNYSTKTSPQQKNEVNKQDTEGEVANNNNVADPTTQVLGTSTPTSTTCKIKGNISTTAKIYHVPGGAFYKTVKPEMCFNTEAEAIAAGFRKSGR